MKNMDLGSYEKNFSGHFAMLRTPRNIDKLFLCELYCSCDRVGLKFVMVPSKYWLWVGWLKLDPRISWKLIWRVAHSAKKNERRKEIKERKLMHCCNSFFLVDSKSCGLVVKNDLPAGENAAGRWKEMQQTLGIANQQGGILSWSYSVRVVSGVDAGTGCDGLNRSELFWNHS